MRKKISLFMMICLLLPMLSRMDLQAANVSETQTMKPPIISFGSAHAVVLKQDGTLWTWGNNSYGQLANGEEGYSTSLSKPAQIVGINHCTDVDAGGFFTLALKENGTVWAWGMNEDGELGNNDSATGHWYELETFVKQNESHPVKVANLSNVVQISAGFAHGTALKSDGTVWTWGYNNTGELGNGTRMSQNKPVKVAIDHVVQIEAGAGATMALKSDGTLWVWGALGSLLGTGDNSKDISMIPIKVEMISDVQKFNFSESSVVAIKNDGTTWGWGYNFDRRFGSETNDSDTIPVTQLNTQSKMVDIFQCRDGIFGLDQAGILYACGNKTSTVIEQLKLHDIIAITGNTFNSMYLLKDGDVVVTGFGDSGQLGDDKFENNFDWKNVPHFNALIADSSTIYKPENTMEIVMNSPFMEINGVQKEMMPGENVTARNINNRILIPARPVFEAMGGRVTWNTATQVVHIEFEGKIIEMKLNQTEAVVDGFIYQLDVAPQIINNRLLVPLRFVIEASELDIDWISAEQTVQIRY